MNAAMARIESVIVTSPLGKLLGVEVVEMSEDEGIVRLPYRSEVTTIGDLVHGGAVSSLIDICATAAAWSGVDPENPPVRGTTLGLTVNFVSGGRGSDLIATGRIDRRGKSICYVNVEVRDTAEQLVARGVVTYKLG